MHPIETNRLLFEKRLKELFRTHWCSKAFFTIFLATCSIMLSGCQPPIYKEAYLRQFDEFSSRVQANCGELTAQDFKALYQTYQKFSREWYELFEQQMTLADKAQVWKYRSRYLKCKGLHILEGKAEQLYRQVEGRLIPPNS